MNPEIEAQLARKLREDPQTFRQVYEYYFAPVYRFIAARVENVQDAEDVVSAVFIKALRHHHDLRSRHAKSLTAWLFTIARNAVIDFYRRKKPDDMELSPALPGNSESPDWIEAIAVREQAAEIRRLLVSLPERQHEIIVLRYFSGVGNKDIAAILNLDERTVSSHLSRGLKTLRERYHEQYPEKTSP